MSTETKVAEATDQVARTVLESDNPKLMLKILIVVGSGTVIGVAAYKLYNKFFKKDKEEIITEEDISDSVTEAMSEVEEETEEDK